MADLELFTHGSAALSKTSVVSPLASHREVAIRPRQAAGGKADGECFARISVRTLLVKKWKTTYFIFELPDLLLLYRSRDDHMYNPRGTMIKKRVEVKHNHTLTRLKRKVGIDGGGGGGVELNVLGSLGAIFFLFMNEGVLALA